MIRLIKMYRLLICFVILGPTLVPYISETSREWLLCNTSRSVLECDDMVCVDAASEVCRYDNHTTCQTAAGSCSEMFCMCDAGFARMFPDQLCQRKT